MNKSKWNNYFGNIQNKYNLKMNKNQPIVLFVDGKDITKSLQHDLITEERNSFNDILEQTVKMFSEKYECLAISGVDEVSFIFENSKKIQEILPIKTYRAHDIISLFSQQFYKIFNEKYKKGPVYWHCKCSNIPKGKIKSYIKFRSLTIYELKLTYFLKRKQFRDSGKIALFEKENKAKEILGYDEIKESVKGNLYIKGYQIDLEAFLQDKIIKIPTKEREEKKQYFDLSDF